MQTVVILFIFVCSSYLSEALFNVRKFGRNVSVGNGNYGKPLYLTPYIDSGDIEAGQRAALVKPLYGQVVSYSGFLTVDKRYDSNIFIWFFPAETNNATAPLLVWLQGGPGASSLYGLFYENGPYYFGKGNKIFKRKYTWTKNINVIYIDSPVGTGFSFTRDDRGYARNEDDVANNLLRTVRQFLSLFPQYRKNNFYLSGESYAGKYVPALGYYIDKYNKNARLKINLKGLAIGNGLCDPITQLNYADYLYQLGLIDRNGRKKMKQIQQEIINLIKKEDYKRATEVLDQIFGGPGEPGIFEKLTGIMNYYNYLYAGEDTSLDDIANSINYIRPYIHVGNSTFNDGLHVQELLKEDFTKSIKPWFQILIEKYRIILYNGQLDIIVAYPLTENFVYSLMWSGSVQYKTAKRKIWYVDGELAGYTKTVKNFTEILVRNAGHTVPHYQPKWSLVLIQNFVSNTPF